MGILEKFLKGNKFYLELDNDKEVYKWSTKVFKKAKSNQADLDQSKSDRSLENAKGELQNGKSGENLIDADQSATQAIDTSYRKEPAWIKALFSSKEELAEKMAKEKTFAADLAVTKPRPNRRPGGSIDKFRDLAREMK